MMPCHHMAAAAVKLMRLWIMYLYIIQRLNGYSFQGCEHLGCLELQELSTRYHVMYRNQVLGEHPFNAFACKHFC